MIQKLKRTSVVAVILAAVLVLAAAFVGRDRPASAQTFTLNQGRYQYVDLTADAEDPGNHFAIFDSESGILTEWDGKKGGDVYVYDVRDERDIIRRSISVH